MAIDVIFPLLGLAVEKGKILKWLKAEGDSVQKGEPLFELEAEKVTTEVESPASGTLRKILIEPGLEIPVFTVVAVITAPDEQLPKTYLSQETLPPPVPKRHVRIEGVEKRSEPARQEAREIKAPPAVRKLAKEKGIDLSRILGSGPEGTILMRDLEGSMAKRTVLEEGKIPYVSAEADGEIIPLSTMRQVIARRMTQSFQCPHFYLTVEVDTGELEKARQQLIPIVESMIGIRLTYTDLLVKMASQALEDHPAINCTYAGDGMKQFKRIDIGLVTFVEGGLVVPIIRQANQKGLTEIAKVRVELIQRARERKLALEEMTGSTFTISNLGMFGIDQFSAILNPPEAAMLAVGRIAERPVVREGQIVSRPMMALTLSIDHRILDGVVASQFLQTLKGFIENPVHLLL